MTSTTHNLKRQHGKSAHKARASWQLLWLHPPVGPSLWPWSSTLPPACHTWGVFVSRPGINPVLLQWMHRVLSMGLPGTSRSSFKGKQGNLGVWQPPLAALLNGGSQVLTHPTPSLTSEFHFLNFPPCFKFGRGEHKFNRLHLVCWCCLVLVF